MNNSYVLLKQGELCCIIYFYKEVKITNNIFRYIDHDIYIYIVSLMLMKFVTSTCKYLMARRKQDEKEYFYVNVCILL